MWGVMCNPMPGIPLTTGSPRGQEFDTCQAFHGWSPHFFRMNMDRNAREAIERGWTGRIERREGLVVTFDWCTSSKGVPIVMRHYKLNHGTSMADTNKPSPLLWRFCFEFVSQLGDFWSRLGSLMRLGQLDWLVSAPYGLSSASGLAWTRTMVKAELQESKKKLQGFLRTRFCHFLHILLATASHSPTRLYFLMIETSKSHLRGLGIGQDQKEEYVGPFCNQFTTGSLKKRKGTKKIGGWPGKGLWSLRSWQWITFNSW